jgi:hypothetical protein
MSEAKLILKRNIEKYHRSTLFIYFQGRLERIEVKIFGILLILIVFFV